MTKLITTIVIMFYAIVIYANETYPYLAGDYHYLIKTTIIVGVVLIAVAMQYMIIKPLIELVEDIK